MAKPTQRDRVLALLREAGGRGVHTFELRQAMIANPSERVRELEAAGYHVEHSREKLHGQAVGTRYVLHAAGGAARPSPSEESVRPSADQAAGGVDAGRPTERSGPDDGTPADLFGERDEPKVPSAFDPYRESEAA